jgi:hypothetical protein
MAIGDPIYDGLVQVRMSFDVSRQMGRTGQIVRDWFDLAWRELGGSIRDRLAATPPAAGPVPHGLYVLATTTASEESGVFFEYNMTLWEDFLERIATEPLRNAFFNASGSDGGGTMLSYFSTDDYWQVYLDRWTSADGMDLVQLTVESREDYLFADPVREAAVVAFLERMVQAADADYAEAAFGYGGLETCVDRITSTWLGESMAQAREVLRGYSWLTMVPPSLVPHVGGVAGLQASGAFVAVEALANGATLLRATEHFRDYRDVEAARVFEVLRPVLRPDAKASAFRRHVDVLEL